jgi:hypothetical protein
MLRVKKLWFPAALLLAGVGLRATENRGALLYPDGYQYLLMARGIAAHLRPVLQLGAGGDLFVPNGDAAAKPLFPALVALVHSVGLGWRHAAELVTVAAAGSLVALCGLLGARLGGSRAAGALAAAFVALAPAMRHWAAFTSPDPLGAALAAAAALAAMAQRWSTAGVLAGLAACARPELGLLLVAGGVLSLVRRESRPAARAFVTAACLSMAVVLVVVRPPLELQPTEVTGAALLALSLAAAGMWLSAPVAVMIGTAVAAAAAVRAPALRQLVEGGDAPLVIAGVAGLLCARRLRGAAVVATLLGGLAVLYATKNGGNGRYAAELVPLLTLGVALGVRSIASARPIAGRAAVAAVTAAACVCGFVAAPGPPVADSFGSIARELPPTRTPLVTAAADAYGFLLYPRPVRWLRPGRRGFVLLDGAARAYDPSVDVRGRVIARLDSGNGFLRPDGRLDLRPAALVVSG